MPSMDEYAKAPVAVRLKRLERTPDELAGAVRGQSEAALARRPDPKLSFDPATPDRWAEERHYLRNDVAAALTPRTRWKAPYADDATGEPRWRPPYPRREPRRAPARPRRGHFDHLAVGTRAFWACHVFATVRCVREIWEHCFGRRLPWFFKDPDAPRLEIIPRAESANAWSSEGFLEFGYLLDRRRRPAWLCENFDVVAHETGHLILKSVIGNPTNAKKTLDYRAHEEAAADLVAVVACLHFDEVVRRLLRNTKGRLFSRNLLSRLGEEGRRSQIRTAFNAATMWSPSVVRADAAYDKHGFSKPFSGGAFDLFVEIYERHLVRRGAIPAALARRSRSAVATALAGLAREAVHRRFRRLRRAFAEHFVGAEETFRQALGEARDDFARLLARTWDRTSVRDFPGRGPAYAGVVTNMLAADRAVTGGRYGEIIRKAFRQRGIVPSGRRA